MTPKQEQLVLTMLTKLADEGAVLLHWFDGIVTKTCIFCSQQATGGLLWSGAVKTDPIIHSNNCLVTLAKQLQETLQQEEQQ